MAHHIVSGKATRSAIDLGERLGGGGEGTAYKVVNDTDAAVKIYTVRENAQVAQMPSRLEKIVGMLGNKPKHRFHDHQGTRLPLLAWPTNVVEDENKNFAGFLMPLVPDERATRFSQYLIEIANPTSMSDWDRSLTNRLRLCRSLASIVAELHRLGHFVVDFKPENLRVFNGSGIPCLLDNDSFSIVDEHGHRFPASAYSPGYASPELLETTSPEDIDNDAQDRFALAVLFFQVLNGGIHPFMGRLKVDDETSTDIDSKVSQGLYAYGQKPHSRVDPLEYSYHDCLLLATRMFFDRAFGGRPQDRPSAKDWREHFDYIVQVSKPFERCTAFPESPVHIHFADLPCLECRRLKAKAAARAGTDAKSEWRHKYLKLALKIGFIGGGLILLLYWLN
jgi:DNA-binding helix-hairpin-helix protein with protein kinase domain